MVAGRGLKYSDLVASATVSCVFRQFAPGLMPCGHLEISIDLTSSSVVPTAVFRAEPTGSFAAAKFGKRASLSGRWAPVSGRN